MQHVRAFAMADTSISLQTWLVLCKIDHNYAKGGSFFEELAALAAIWVFSNRLRVRRTINVSNEDT